MCALECALDFRLLHATDIRAGHYTPELRPCQDGAPKERQGGRTSRSFRRNTTEPREVRQCGRREVPYMRKPVQPRHAPGVPLAAAVMTLAASLAAPRAQQAGTNPPPKPLVPVAANTMTANPDAYYGEHVTLTAAVEQVVSPSAFSVAQRAVGDTGHAVNRSDVLILAPTLNRGVDLNSYVTVLGEVVRFDPAE